MITRQNEQGNIRNKYHRLIAAVWREHNQNMIGASNHQRACGSNFMAILTFSSVAEKKQAVVESPFLAVGDTL